MNAYVVSEVQSACNALGALDRNTAQYIKEPDCLETVRDITRLLKRYDGETCRVRRLLGTVNIMATDLIPLMVQHCADNDDLLLAVLRLTTNLTQPAVICFEGKLPKNKEEAGYFLEVEQHLIAYKKAFASAELFNTLATKLKVKLESEMLRFSDDDKDFVQLILMLFRNILHIPPSDADRSRPDSDVTVQDQVVFVAHTSGFLDLLLYLATPALANERSFALYVLEAVAMLYVTQDPAELARTGCEKAARQEREKVNKEAARTVAREAAREQAQSQTAPRRHSRFGGSYWVNGVKALDASHRIVATTPLTESQLAREADILTHDCRKRGKRIPKNRAPALETEQTRTAALSIRMILRDFAVAFAQRCYNSFLRSVKTQLARDRVMEHYETYYFELVAFYLAFARRATDVPLGLISETINVNAFHYAQVQIEKCIDMMKADKAEGRIWGKRAHVALKTYRELLFMLNYMDGSKTESVRRSSEVIKSNIFYMMEYRDLLLTLFRRFEPVYLSKAYLKCLIETNHIFLKILEKYSGNKSLVVQSKKRQMKKRQKKKNIAKDNEPSREQLENQWEELTPGVTALLQSGEVIHEEQEGDFTVLDPLLEDDETRRREAMLRIQDAARAGNVRRALGLQVSARTLWPENFAAETSPEDQLVELREIFLTEIAAGHRPKEDGEEPEEVEAASEEEEDTRPARQDVAFDLLAFLLRYAHGDVMCWYVHALEDFATNRSETNHSIASMFKRLCVDLDIIPLLYQARLFRIFQRVFNDPRHAKDPELQNIRDVAIFILRKFAQAFQSNTKLLAELLFWKNSKDCFDLQHGYGTHQTERASKSHANLWPEELEEQLRMHYDTYSEMEEKPRGLDVAAYIETHLDPSRTRRQIIRQMRIMGIDIGGLRAGAAKSALRGGTGNWTEEEVVELRTLFNEHRQDPDPVGQIIVNLEKPRPRRRVAKQLLAMKLISSLREVAPPSAREAEQQNFQRAFVVDRGEAGNDDYLEEGVFAPQRSSEDEDDDSEEEEEPEGGVENEYERPAPTTEEQDHFATVMAECSSDDQKNVLLCVAQVLRGEAEDRRAEPGGYVVSDDHIPLVLLENAQYLADENVTEALKAVGLLAPVEGQEVYWRIPGYFMPEDIDNVIEALKGEAHRLLPRPHPVRKNPAEKDLGSKHDGEVVDDMEPISRSSQKKRSRASRLDEMAKRRASRLAILNEGDSSSDDDDEPLSQSVMKSSEARPSEGTEEPVDVLDSDQAHGRVSDNHDDDELVETTDTPIPTMVHTAEKPTPTTANHRRRRIVASDSENEEEVVELVEEEVVEEEAVKTPQAKRKRIVSSDSE